MSTATGTLTETATPRLSLPERVVGVFASPRKLFASLRDHPVWLDVMILYIVVSIACYIPLQPIIQRESLEKARDQLESAELSPEQKAQAIERQEGIMRTMLSLPVGIAMVVVASPIIFLFWSVILLLAFGFMIGGRLRFVQVFSAVTHLSLILLLGSLLKLPLMLGKGSMQVATSLALLLPEIDPTSPTWVFLNVFDIFIIWTIIVMAIGMVVMARVSAGKARGAAIGVFVFTLVLSLVGPLLSSLGKRG